MFPCRVQSSEMPIGMDIADMPRVTDETLIALGPHQSPLKVTGPVTVTCILCQEEQRISHSARAMVLSAFVQQ